MTRLMQLERVLRERRRMYEGIRSSGPIGRLVRMTIDVIVFAPLIVLAKFGLLWNRRGAQRSVPPSGEGPASSGVGAGLPTIPPTLSGGNARAYPPPAD